MAERKHTRLIEDFINCFNDGHYEEAACIERDLNRPVSDPIVAAESSVRQASGNGQEPVTVGEHIRIIKTIHRKQTSAV